MKENVQNKVLSPVPAEKPEDIFVSARTVFENDVVIVAKAYYCQELDRKLNYYYTIDVGEKDAMGDVDAFQTVVSKQMVCME